MPRKFAAVLSALALALCFSRAGAWAATIGHGDVHACCHHGAPAKTQTLIECCVVTAAVGSVHLARVDASPFVLASAVPPVAPAFVSLVLRSSVPGRAQFGRAAVPARGPPLA